MDELLNCIINVYILYYFLRYFKLIFINCMIFIDMVFLYDNRLFLVIMLNMLKFL